MTQRFIRTVDDRAFTDGFARIRERMAIEVDHSPAVHDDAVAAAKRGPTQAERSDRTDIAFVAIDPPGSMDLDQAYHAERRGDGYRVHYAIADVAAWVEPGSPTDVAAHERGVTLYSPDLRAGLYPPALSEAAASLLPDGPRPAALWTLDLDAKGRLTGADVERAMVHNTAALNYREVAAAIEDGSAAEPLRLLKVIGELRIAIEIERGGVSLRLASQEVIDTTIEGGYELVYDESLPVEGWNAQISLLTGMAAAEIMIDGGIGVLRTLPPADRETLAELGRHADALGIDWPDGQDYAAFIRSLDPASNAHAALLTQATRVLRGAGYASFDGELPKLKVHAAIASSYAHVTAPLRRLVDRYTNEICLSLCAGEPVAEWVRARLEDLPQTMADSRRRERSLDRAIVDFVEALTLSNRLGESFEAIVTSRRSDDMVALQLRDPAVVCTVRDNGALEPGTAATVRLASTNAVEGKVTFELV